MSNRLLADLLGWFGTLEDSTKERGKQSQYCRGELHLLAVGSFDCCRRVLLPVSYCGYQSQLIIVVKGLSVQIAVHTNYQLPNGYTGYEAMGCDGVPFRALLVLMRCLFLCVRLRKALLGVYPT
jgi:hypothetical protein